jgi:hypothetical protein
MKREITFFHTDKVEWQTLHPIAVEAESRRYLTRFSDQLDAPAEIGFYCSHCSSPRNSRFSAIMLHDLAQRHDIWPDYWQAEPWNAFDLGFLPGPSWGARWYRSSRHAFSRPRLGVFQLGWPKADSLFCHRDDFEQRVTGLRQKIDLRHPVSILYAPSWENHGKQNDFVRALRNLPVNLLLKQAPWSNSYPEVLASIAEMNALHRHAGPDVHIIDPDIGIIDCLALADIMVSDESSVLIEALLLDVPGISVTDWLIPDTSPPRQASVPFDFITKTELCRLRETVDDMLNRLPEVRRKHETLRDQHFSCLGRSACSIMDVLDACVDGLPNPYEPLMQKPHPLFELARNFLQSPRGRQ